MNIKTQNLIIQFLLLFLYLTTSVTDAKLIVHWKLDETSGNIISDSSGNGLNGIVHGKPVWVRGKDHNALKFNGKDNYVDLPIGPLIASLTDCTFSVWVNFQDTNNLWQRIFDFGSSRTVNMFLTPRAGITGTMRFAITNGGQATEYQVNSTDIFPRGWHHVILTIDTMNDTISLYLDAKLVAKNTTASISPSGLGNTTQNRLGRSQYTADAYFNGLMDDFRIYDHTMNTDEVTKLYLQYFISSSHKYLQAVRDAEAAFNEQNPKKVIAFIEDKISEYELWKKQNPNELSMIHEQLLCELYFLLAKAREAANVPSKEIADAYKKSISSLSYRQNYVPAFLWLFSNSSADDYIGIIKTSAGNYCGIPENLNLIAGDFESSKNWAAFELFLDAVLLDTDDQCPLAEEIAAGMNKNGLWSNSFYQYVQNKPQLIQYHIKALNKRAEEKTRQNDFTEAAAIYNKILNLCHSNQDKDICQVQIYECIFKSGQCSKALLELDNLINNDESITQETRIKAMLLKGKIHLQLNEISRAIETYSNVAKKYPESDLIPEACFFVGYCNMIEGKTKQAKESFSLIVKKFPQNSYTRKAQLCLSRIEKRAG